MQDDDLKIFRIAILETALQFLSLKYVIWRYCESYFPVNYKWILFLTINITVRVWNRHVFLPFSTRVLDFIWVMSTPLTPSWQDNTSGLIMARSNVHFTSLSFSCFLVPLFIHTFISRQSGECVGSILRDPVGVYCSIPFDQCFDGFYFLCDSTWLLCPLKKCQVSRLIESFNENWRVNIDFFFVRH